MTHLQSRNDQRGDPFARNPTTTQQQEQQGGGDRHDEARRNRNDDHRRPRDDGDRGRGDGDRHRHPPRDGGRGGGGHDYTNNERRRDDGGRRQDNRGGDPKRSRANNDDEDKRSMADGRLAMEALNFHLRQSVVRLLQRRRGREKAAVSPQPAPIGSSSSLTSATPTTQQHQTMTPNDVFDRIFINYALHCAHPQSIEAKMLYNSKVREEWMPFEVLLVGELVPRLMTMETTAVNNANAQGSSSKPTTKDTTNPQTNIAPLKVLRGEIDDLANVAQVVLEHVQRDAYSSSSDLAAKLEVHSLWGKIRDLLDALINDEEAKQSMAEKPKPCSVLEKDEAEWEQQYVEMQTLELLETYGEKHSLSEIRAQLKALANASIEGIDQDFYAAASRSADILCAQKELALCSQQFPHGLTPPDPPADESILGFASHAITSKIDKPLSEADCYETMTKTGEELEQDQKLMMEEIVDYYKTQQPQPQWLVNYKQQQQSAGSKALSTRLAPRKPERFGKVITGFLWNKYNRAHFDSSNPDNLPPKEVQAYEFTLIYTELVDKPQRRPKFEVLPDPKDGWDGSHCLLVFSAGEPYLDVAYRILNRAWDKRPGGHRATYEATGKYKVFFRLSSEFHKR